MLHFKFPYLIPETRPIPGVDKTLFLFRVVLIMMGDRKKSEETHTVVKTLEIVSVGDRCTKRFRLIVVRDRPPEFSESKPSVEENASLASSDEKMVWITPE